MKALKEVITLFEEVTEDIENVLDKEYLKDAIAGTIYAEAPHLPYAFVREAVAMIYLSEDT